MSNYKLRAKGYKAVRNLAIRFTEESLEGPIEMGDTALSALYRLGFKGLFSGKLPENQAVSLYDLRFPSPIIFSSFKGELTILELWLNLGMGGGLLKTAMIYPRIGNPRPRIQEVFYGGEECLINAMGLPGPGVEALCRSIEQSALFSFNRPIGISLGGGNAQEYVQVAKTVEDSPYFKDKPLFFEINASCPNTDDGQDMLNHPSLIAETIAQIRVFSDRVIGVKLSPDQSDESLIQCADVIAPLDRVYINTGNTQFKSCEDVGLPAKALSRGGGGLSGPVLYERTLEMIKLLSTYDCPLMATGGINSLERVIEIREAGATLVGMATALVQNPYCIPWINQGLSR